MRFRNPLPLPFTALLGCVLAATIAAGAPALTSVIAVVATSDPGAVRVSGAVAGTRKVQVVLYASFAPDVPLVLLRKRLITADTDGRFETTLSIAPASFSGAVITALVQTPAGLAIGRGQYTVTGTAVVNPGPS